MEPVAVIRAVAVSPGDVRNERERLQQVVDGLNRTLAPSRGCRLSLWRWETDAHPGLHLEGPQGLIDAAMAIEDADVVIGIFWTRFGTPSGDADSGTEHELRRAWAAWRECGRPQVKVYFCERESRPKDVAAAEQLAKLLAFRDAMPKEQLWWTFKKAIEFERAAREDLTAFVLGYGARDSPASPDEVTAQRRRVRLNMPLQPAYFAGREAELAAIDEALGVADRAVVTQAIGGLAGSARASSPRATCTCTRTSTTSSRGSPPRTAGRRTSQRSPASSAIYPRTCRSTSAPSMRCAGWGAATSAGCSCSTTSPRRISSPGAARARATAACSSRPATARSTSSRRCSRSTSSTSRRRSTTSSPARAARTSATPPAASRRPSAGCRSR